jgi:hypothetical protein
MKTTELAEKPIAANILGEQLRAGIDQPSADQFQPDGHFHVDAHD